MALLLTSIRTQNKNLLWIGLLLLLLIPNLQKAQALQLSDYNPISHWTCDESSGVRYDSNTTNSNDLTDNNTVLSAVGLLGNACDFESTNSEYLSIADGDQLNLDLTSDFSINFWINPESLPPTDTRHRLVSKLGSTNGYEIDLTNFSGTQYVETRIYSGGSGDSATGAQTISTWKMVTWLFNATTKVHRIYINAVGIATSTETVANPGNGDPFRIGVSSETLTGYYDGKMDEISIFGSQLSMNELNEIYNLGTPLPYTATSSPTSTSTASSTVDMSDTNFLLVVVIFFLTFIFLGLAFSPLNRKK